MSSPSAPAPANFHLLPFTSVPEEHTSPSTPVSYSAVIAPLSPSASPYWLVNALDFCREHRVMPILTTLTTESSLLFFPLCIFNNDWRKRMIARSRKQNPNSYFGGVHRRKKLLLDQQALLCPQKSQPSKPKVSPDESWRQKKKKEKVCVCVTLCVLV